jgi:hypothetical protein
MGTPKTHDGRPLVAYGKSDLPRRQIYSHDWTDKTTWFHGATRVVTEAATFVSGGTWSLAHQNVIDTHHGKLFAEDYLTDESDHSYRVVVTVDGVSKNENDPHDNAGDYLVDYAAGTLTFGTPPSSEADVRVTYHYAGGSTFVVAPNPGKLLTIDLVEVQFSQDVEITDSARFQVWVYAPAELCTAMGWPLGTKVPYGEPAMYKGIRDYLADAMRSYVPYGAMGGDSWRGMPVGVIIFDWDYLASIPLASSVGAEIRVSLDHDVPFGGTYATASFYCTEDDE